MTKPLLSICIPTYNRAEYLEKSLESLVSQPEFAQIEVVISDNASTDNTEEVCRSYQKKYPNIHYFKNTENIHDRNFPSVLMRASGVYRKLFNDTVIYEKDCLAYIIELIKKYTSDRIFLFFLNAQKLPRRINAECLLNDFEDFCTITGHRLTWIASFGLWEEDCENLDAEFSFCNLSLWQTYKTLRIASRQKKVLLLSKKIISIQSVTNRDYSYGLYTVFYKNFPSLLKPYIDSGELSESAYKKIRKDMLYTQAAPWIFRISETVRNNDVGSETNYKNLILDEYRHEPYYPQFVLWNFFHYQLKNFHRKPLILLKKTGFGKKLLVLKRKMDLKLY